MRKGQMIFEFMVAAVLFFGIIIYVLSMLSASMASYGTDAYSNALHSRAFAVSELLVASEGNWSGSVPISIGLALDYPVLSTTKMNDFDTYCQNNYLAVLNKLNLLETPYFLRGSGKTYNIFIEINETSGANRVTCGIPKGGALFSEVRRVALSDDSPQKVLIANIVVW